MSTAGTAARELRRTRGAPIERTRTISIFFSLQWVGCCRAKAWRRRVRFWSKVVRTGDMLKLRGDALEWREVDSEVVVLVKSSSTYIAVNSSGAAIWPALAAGASRDELVSLLRAEFDVDADRAAADVDSFVHALSAQDLLERAA